MSLAGVLAARTAAGKNVHSKTATCVEQTATTQVERSFLVVSLSDGIGGVRQALQLLKANVLVFIAIECNKHCRKVTRKMFDVTLEYVWIEEVTEVVVEMWFEKSGDIKVLWTAGSPCQNLSSLQGSQRLGLRGAKSLLFWEAPRIRRLSKQYFTLVVGLLENVQSMPQADFDVICEALCDCQAVSCDASCVALCMRGRYYWLYGFMLDRNHDAEIVQKTPSHVVVSFKCQRLPLTAFVEPDAVARLGECSRYPTLTRPIPKAKLPEFVPSWDRCSNDAKQRYLQNNMRYQPHQYEEEYLIDSPQGPRLLNANEREQMMNFRTGHTKHISKGFGTDFAEQLEDMRCDALGNSFQCVVVARLLAVPIVGSAHNVTCDDLWAVWSQQEKSERFDIPTVDKIAAREVITKAEDVTRVTVDWTPEQQAVYAHLRCCDLRGTDVRLTPVQFFRPHAWSRQSIDMSQWK